jgi:hypothetical protein
VLPLIVAVLPPALIVVSVLQTGTTVPMEDHWDMIPLLERDAAGTLRFGDLWAQQNEHRYVVPWLFMIGLARFTRWNIATELLLNVAFSLAALGVLAALIVRSVRGRSRVLVPWLVLAASLMTFSLVKWENWFWSMSQPAFASALAACVTVAVLARLGPTLAGTALATLAAIAGVLSFANGFVLFAVVPLGILADPRAPLRRRVWLALGSVVASVAMTLVYLAGLRHPAKHPDPWLFLKRPIAFTEYVLAYVGAPLGWPEPGWSIAWGALGVTALAIAALSLAIRRPASRIDVLPWLLLALWVLGSGALAGVGRLGMGVAQAVSSRYTTMSTFFWISVAVVVAMAVVDVLERVGPSHRVAVGLVAAAVLGTVAAAGSYAAVWVRSDAWRESLEESHALARECLHFHREAPDGCLAIMHHDPPLVRRRAAILERLRLGPFVTTPSRPPLSSFTVVDSAEPVGAIAGGRVRLLVVTLLVGSFQEYRSVEVSLGGWAKDPSTGRPPPALLIVANGAVLEEVPMPADAVSAGAPGRPAWFYRFSTFRLGSGARTVEVYAVLDGRRIARLGARALENLARP